MLKEKRIELGLTQKELAKKIGVTRQSVSLYEKGLRIPGYAISEKIIDELDLCDNEKQKLYDFFIEVIRKR